MNNFKLVFNPLKWFLEQLSAAFVAGCVNDGGGAGGPDSAITGNTGSGPVTAAKMDTITRQKILTGNIYGSDTVYSCGGNLSCFKGITADNAVVANAILDLKTALHSDGVNVYLCPR
jgi:hypothetical protein